MKHGWCGIPSVGVKLIVGNRSDLVNQSAGRSGHQTIGRQFQRPVAVSLTSKYCEIDRVGRFGERRKVFPAADFACIEGNGAFGSQVSLHLCRRHEGISLAQEHRAGNTGDLFCEERDPSPGEAPLCIGHVMVLVKCVHNFKSRICSLTWIVQLTLTSVRIMWLVEPGSARW